MGDMFNQYGPSFLLDVKGENGKDVEQCDEIYELPMGNAHHCKSR